MRTQTVLLTAALGVVSIATAVAQVYSVNAVGYVNVTIPANSWSLIANPLNNQTDNDVATLFPSAPDGCIVYLWTGASFDINTMFFGAWDHKTTLAPGSGFWFLNPAGNPSYAPTFVGEVMQGALSNPVPAGFSMKASQVPQAGLLVTDLKYPGPNDGDMVYQWTSASSSWKIYTFSSLFGWDPAEPSFGVGEAFWVNNAGAATAWTRSFDINNP